MKKQKLRFGATFREGLVYAGRNFFPLLGCILLYFLTIWIPYLNIDDCHDTFAGTNV